MTGWQFNDSKLVIKQNRTSDMSILKVLYHRMNTTDHTEHGYEQKLTT